MVIVVVVCSLLVYLQGSLGEETAVTFTVFESSCHLLLPV